MTNEPLNRLQMDRLEDESGRAVLRLRGEIDLQTATELDAELRRLGAEHPDSGTLVDLTGVEFIDSTGLGVILHAHMAAQERGHRLVFRRGGLQVQRLFELTGVGDRISFEG